MLGYATFNEVARGGDEDEELGRGEGEYKDFESAEPGHPAPPSVLA